MDWRAGDNNKGSGMTPGPVKMSTLRRSCTSCTLRELCLPRSLDADQLVELEATVKGRVLQPNEALYRIGDRLSSVYVVRSGSVSVHLADPSGAMQIVGFHLPGELLGLDGLQSGQHPTGCVALETSSICSMPYFRLEELCALIPKLNQQLLRLMSKEISSEQQLLLSLGHRDLEQRLAVFLLDLSRRWRNLGYSAVRFRLTMRRDHIASYLGSSAESVSRTFSRLRDMGVVALRAREVHLVDLPRLVEISGATAQFRNLLSAG